MELRVVKLRPEATVPDRAHDHDAGLDLYNTQEHMIFPGHRHLCPTGVALALPEGHVGLIRDRSGLAYREGLTVMAGVIDEGYRGEVHVLLYNTGDRGYMLRPGHRIAQLLVVPISHVRVVEVDSLDDTARGAGGFGSSGR